MKWALYALEGSNAYDWPVVEELKERLAQPAPVPEAHKQEPVGYFSVNDYGRWEENEGTYGEPLYTAPPKREWVGLTDEQIIGLWQDTKEPDGHRIERFARAIEAKLREKNTW
jgi:hypothetical protein